MLMETKFVGVAGMTTFVLQLTHNFFLLLVIQGVLARNMFYTITFAFRGLNFIIVAACLFLNKIDSTWVDDFQRVKKATIKGLRKDNEESLMSTASFSEANPSFNTTFGFQSYSQIKTPQDADSFYSIEYQRCVTIMQDILLLYRRKVIAFEDTIAMVDLLIERQQNIITIMENLEDRLEEMGEPFEDPADLAAPAPIEMSSTATPQQVPLDIQIPPHDDKSETKPPFSGRINAMMYSP
jgi:hypothetical protein